MKTNRFKTLLTFLSVIGFLFIYSGCDEELPAAGSLVDETPPNALFSFSQGENNYLSVTFTNESASATDYVWDFGDGNTSTEREPTNIYAGDGDYTVSLMASDKLGATSDYSTTISLVEPDEPFAPVILEAGFEDGSSGSEICGEGNMDGRDCWRNSNLGGVIQITGSPVFDGAQSAKLPTSNDRIGYQLVTVEAETDYILGFYYTLKPTPVGAVTVSILSGPVDDPANIAAATIASGSYSDQTDDQTYIRETLNFNSGSSTQIAIYFYTTDVEARLDNFTIVEN